MSMADRSCAARTRRAWRSAQGASRLWKLDLAPPTAPARPSERGREAAAIRLAAEPRALREARGCVAAP
jgi:hypothetical protein